MGLIDAIGAGPVGLDTSVFIYWVEEHPRYSPVLDPLFQAIDGGIVTAVTSELTLLEVLVVPLGAGDQPLADEYEAVLGSSRNLRLIAIDRSQLRAAAVIRALHGLRTPDAIQLAAALAGGCRAFVTNDHRLPAAVGGLAIRRLDDWI